MAGILVSAAPRRPVRTAPADIGAARETLYGAFQDWMWTQGAGTMQEIESDLRSGELKLTFQYWLRSHKHPK